MGGKFFYLLVASTLIAYYIYQPLPENVEEPWKVMLLDASFRSLIHVATIVEKLGVGHFMDVLNLHTIATYTPPISDEKVIVTDTEFSHVPVRLYIPTKQSDVLKRAVIFIHGGGWCIGSAIFLGSRSRSIIILRNPGMILDDPDVRTKFKIQALLYPGLQSIDLELPSYQDNKNIPILSKTLVIRFLSEYITSDESFSKALETNQHVPAEFNHLFQFVNWSKWLPERFKKGHIYTDPSHRNSKTGHKYPDLLDPRSGPLLVEDIKLQGLPLTYIMTCQYDVLRDDGIMYVSRLREAGVEVTHEHVDNAFHGVVTFITGAFAQNIGHRMANNYIEWLNKNL
ncbi:arylacetamide deacetylase-like [Thamnophis elegans]|uniref:arylacetamide deacetylase-like n=1 Tax=Thamnophis elegans TaxID=35005 RepID=UPI001377F030|nr:arylacetamide deacetylase-like [Thamnophis elegans]